MNGAKLSLAAVSLAAAMAALATSSGDAREGRPTRYSCNAAQAAVEAQGYRIVSTQQCTGWMYTFIATRGGQRYQVNFDPRWGWIKDARPLR